MASQCLKERKDNDVVCFCVRACVCVCVIHLCICVWSAKDMHRVTFPYILRERKSIFKSSIFYAGGTFFCGYMHVCRWGQVSVGGSGCQVCVCVCVEH